MENTCLGKYTVYFSNSTEYHTLKREIWSQNCYYFDTSENTPYIIDVGAHIGLSVLYFKNLYPQSHIIAFEPQEESFAILEQNIEQNCLKDITLIKKAVWKMNGYKDLFIDDTNLNWYSNASFIEHSWNGKEKTKRKIVETTTLTPYLNRNVDCLKIDTEGSELTILKSINSFLPKIKNIIIEYHPRRDTLPQDILKILNKNFDLEVYIEGKKLKKIPTNTLLTIRGISSIK